MTLSLQNFNRALSEAEQLLACFETLNNHPELCIILDGYLTFQSMLIVVLLQIGLC